MKKVLVDSCTEEEIEEKEDHADCFERDRSETELSFTTERHQSNAKWPTNNKSILQERHDQEVRQTEISRDECNEDCFERNESQTRLPLAADYLIKREPVVGGLCEQGARPKTSINDMFCDENPFEDSSMDSETENESEYNSDCKDHAHKGEYKANYKEQIIENFAYLKDNIDADSALDVLSEFLSDRDIEDVNAIVPRYKRVDLMLRMIYRLARGSIAFHALMESFKENGSSFINENLQKQTLPKSSRSLPLTIEEKRRNLKKYKKRLENEIDPQYAPEFFLMRKAISLDKYEKIEVKTTPNRKIKQLLEYIDRGLQECYDVLVAYLSEKEKKEKKDAPTPNTNYLSFLLSRPVTEEPKTTLVKPPRPRYLIKLESVKRASGHSKIKTGSHFNLHITFDEHNQETDFSERVVGVLNEAQIKAELNDQLIPLTFCSYKSSSFGSIVISFKMFRDRIERDQLEFITKIIEMIFNHRGVSAIIPRGNTKFDVQIELQKSSEETCTVAISKRIRCYRQFLIEELDGLKLLAYLRLKSVVSIDEDIYIKTQTSRRSRLSAILDILLRKGPSDLEDFRFYLEKNANNIYVLMWPSMETETERYITSLALDLDQFYSDLIDRVQPSIFLKLDEDFNMPRSLIDELLRHPKRNDQAKMILQHVLLQDMQAKRQFVQMLLFYNQFNKGELQRPTQRLPLVGEKSNTPLNDIAKVRRPKSTGGHFKTDRLPIQLGSFEFCMHSEKSVSKTLGTKPDISRGKAVALSTRAEKTPDSACRADSNETVAYTGEILKQRSSSSPAIMCC